MNITFIFLEAEFLFQDGKRSDWENKLVQTKLAHFNNIFYFQTYLKKKNVDFDEKKKRNSW